MEPAPRRYRCACCRTSVIICSKCDRGNRYCGDVCAQQMRKSSQQAAAKRYQDSHLGRSTRAQRQRLYRERQRLQRERQLKKVTHQGSPQHPPDAPLSSETTELQITEPELAQASHTQWQCHFCKCKCAELVRIDFLRCRIRRPTRLPREKETHHARDP